MKKNALLDKVLSQAKTLPRGKSFFSDLTQQQQEALLALRREKKAGKVAAGYASLRRMLVATGFKVPSCRSFLEWMNSDRDEPKGRKHA